MGPFTVNCTVTEWVNAGEVLVAVTVMENGPVVVMRVGTVSVMPELEVLIEFGFTEQVTPDGQPEVTARLTVALSVAEY